MPLKTEYSLTAFGRSLTPIIDAMCKWGDSYLLKKGSLHLGKKVGGVEKGADGCLSVIFFLFAILRAVWLN